jgi:hypothetical protein
MRREMVNQVCYERLKRDGVSKDREDIEKHYSLVDRVHKIDSIANISSTFFGKSG